MPQGVSQQGCRSQLIIVSHAPATLREFCDVGVLLHDGELVYFDDLDEAIDAHERLMDGAGVGN